LLKIQEHCDKSPLTLVRSSGRTAVSGYSPPLSHAPNLGWVRKVEGGNLVWGSVWGCIPVNAHGAQVGLQVHSSSYQARPMVEAPNAAIGPSSAHGTCWSMPWGRAQETTVHRAVISGTSTYNDSVGALTTAQFKQRPTPQN